MKKSVILFIVLSMLFSGCAWFGKSDKDKSAEVLIKEGMADYEDGDYKGAIKSFEQLRDWYPFSKYAILAELKIADAYFNIEEYEDAIFAYEEFERLHPRNEAIPYVIYRIGRCYFNRIDTIDRDQTNAEKGLNTFKRLIKQFPSDPYAVMAQADIVECYKSLAGHELYVGKFYYKTKHYKAALERFKLVVTRYPDVGAHQEALLYIANCEALIDELEQPSK